LRWVEVVQVEAKADAAAVLAAAADVGPVAWVALRLPGRAATASALVAGTECRTSPVSLVTRKSAQSVARR
jgi:hypothetical protein